MDLDVGVSQLIDAASDRVHPCSHDFIRESDEVTDGSTAQRLDSFRSKVVVWNCITNDPSCVFSDVCIKVHGPPGLALDVFSLSFGIHFAQSIAQFVAFKGVIVDLPDVVPCLIQAFRLFP